MKLAMAVVLSGLLAGQFIFRLGQTFTLESSRVIEWAGTAGLDPIGGIPTGWATDECEGLDNTGATNVRTALQSCLTAADTNEIVTLPAGTYLISGGNLAMKSNMALCGAQAATSPWLPNSNANMTTITIGDNRIVFDGGSRSTSFSPAAPSGTAITSGYTQGSTSLTLSSASTYDVGEVIAVYQDEDSTIIDDKNFDWLGEEPASGDIHVMQSYYEITAKDSNTLTIDRPLYYVTPSHSGEEARVQTFGVQRSGVCNLRISAGGAGTRGIIDIDFGRYIWVSGVETYNAGGDSSGSAHVWTQFSMNNEYRDSYHHHGSSYDSGENYGIEFYNWNSRHKIENTIITNTRHSIVWEGGGSGNVMLYNYTDDNAESVQDEPTNIDESFLSEDIVGNHGAHPMMNLWEGNSATSFWGDYTQGSSSHVTLFRNRIRCQRTNITLDADPWLYVCMDTETYNRYYSYVGNIIGRTSFTSGTVICNSGSCGSFPWVFRFGYSSAGGSYTDSQSRSTAVLYRNYDYVTDGILTNDPGSSLPLANSLYYTSKPSWYGACTWPPVDPMGPTTHDLPAKKRLDGTTC